MQHEKQCTKCGETKPLDEYHRDKSKSGGRRERCKACTNEVVRRYREENPEKAKEQNRRNYLKHREKRLEYNRRYIQENLDYLVERNRRYREENPEKAREWSRRYYEENRDKERERSRRYREENYRRVIGSERRYREENRDHERLRSREKGKSLQVTSSLLAFKNGQPYTPDEDALLLTNNGMTTYQKAITLGRTYNACNNRLHLLHRREVVDV